MIFGYVNVGGIFNRLKRSIFLLGNIKCDMIVKNILLLQSKFILS